MRVFIEGLRIDAEVGALDSERGRRQAIMIDIAADVMPPDHDSMEDACDYRVLAEAAWEVLTGDHIVLIETVAGRIAEACLARTGAASVSVTARKPAALAPALAGVTVTRSRTVAP
jgi:dihydroneopterin aldolase